MSRTALWRWVFLSLTGVVVVMEVIAGTDKSTTTRPWTVEIVEHVPVEIAAPIIGALLFWIPVHFGVRYLRKHRAESPPE